MSPDSFRPSFRAPSRHARLAVAVAPALLLVLAVLLGGWLLGSRDIAELRLAALLLLAACGASLLGLLWQAGRHAYELAESESQLAICRRQLEAQADTDGLTGLANRSRFVTYGGEVCQLAQRHQRPLSLLAIELDRFAVLEAQWSPAVGEQVLLRMARLLETSRRHGDLPARLGGAEFALLLPETPLDRAIEAAERIREAIENAPLMLADSRLVGFTVSVGVAQLRPDDTGLPDLIDLADAALRRAQAVGGNRVEADPARSDPT
ncbi:GGDEF domain-containing protein [Chitinimonas koreensis]|uniref:GGDEF domain-containing protein n=1 Tax=Chitinimonas koreensis TaxID=356302 RepID=UPI00041F639E|nr:GGDEF domain-containing protein [Chitinimonas koreensis]QNM97082.1 GGDEF domain-containing protein [Chitinimonas koreensis]